MGKTLQRNNSMLSIDNRNPGCMWGVLQIVKYHRWNLIKKRNSHKGLNPTRSANEEHDLNACDSDSCPLLYSPEKDFYKAERMNNSTKGSTKSQINTNISDDQLKKNDQLQRCSSYPALSRRLEPADGNLLRSVTMKHKSPNNNLNLNSKAPNMVKNEDSSKSRTNRWDGIRKEFIENRTLVPRNSDRKQSVVNAQEMLDALDLINTNKDLLLKLLQDPTSPFVHHFHNEQSLSSRRKFMRSMSFSSSSPIKVNLDKKGIDFDAGEANSNKFFRQSSSIAPEYKRRNHVVRNRFKDLRHKLKHMLKQNNNEKHRVAMDGILHKIPHGKEVPKDLKRDIVENAKKQGLTKDINESYSSLHSIKGGKCLSRTSSLKESLDRYSQLYESSFNRESKHKDSTSPQVNVLKSFRRMFSSPNLYNYAYHIEDSPIEDSAFHEKQDGILSTEILNETEESNLSEHDSKNKTAESVEDTPIEPETKAKKLEIPSRPLEIEVGPKEKHEFDYVRDVLHLSGFSGSELLGTWHSDDQPLDPSMIEEMDSVLFNSECFGVEEGYPCYNLLLFDLINQVLLEIYAKSYTYYPSPLNCRSQIHPMPVGSRVFEEVWSNISWYLSFSMESEQLLDYIASRDFAKNDGWMNLQFDSECVAMEVDDMIFDDILDDLVFEHFSDSMILEEQFDEVVLS